MKYMKEVWALVKSVWYIPVAIGLTVLVNVFIFRFGMTVGSSMNPTLQNGNPLIISLTSEINRKDIIIFHSDEYQENMVKRIIGMPGDTVQIKNNKIYINNKIIPDSVEVIMEDYGIAADPIVLSDDEYFVMGDNRNHSMDSRVFGPIKKDAIIGKVIYCLAPFKELS